MSRTPAQRSGVFLLRPEARARPEPRGLQELPDPQERKALSEPQARPEPRGLPELRGPQEHRAPSEPQVQLE